MATTSWLFVIFGESQSAVLDLADWGSRSNRRKIYGKWDR
jgi:hypothetical protein